VAGVTRKQDHRSRGIDRLAKASRTRSIARELGRAGLAPENPKLMAKDEDLEVPGAIVAVGANQETGKCPNKQAEEEQHRRILESE
jgi:hypothetical protein